MHILLIGLNYKTAPVEVREKMVFEPNALSIALRHLRDAKSIVECVIVSTCNRTELFVVCDQLHTGEYYAKLFLETWFHLAKDELAPHLYVKAKEEAITHLFRMICGLDSLVLGETQILGQVRDAFLQAQQAKTTGIFFNMLFKQAVTLGKRVHRETEIGQNAVSVGYAAVELGRKIFSSFAERSILLIGAGQMGELTAKHLYHAGASTVRVCNRTLDKAESVAAAFAGQVCPWSERLERIGEVDIVISSTGSTEPIVYAEELRPVLKKRRSPLFLIDIAVPRDIDPRVNELEHVFLFDMDDLQGIVEANLHLRSQEVEKIEGWIAEEAHAYGEWIHTLGVIPLITALREKAIWIQEEAVLRIERKLPELTERERRVIRKHTKSIINQLLRDPMTKIKELAATSEKEEALKLFSMLFSLDEKASQSTEMAKVSSRQGERGVSG